MEVLESWGDEHARWSELGRGIMQLDVGSPKMDVGSPKLDVGSPNMDVGSPNKDVGSPKMEARKARTWSCLSPNACSASYAKRSDGKNGCQASVDPRTYKQAYL